MISESQTERRKEREREGKREGHQIHSNYSKSEKTQSETLNFHPPIKHKK
jgi:hypothetical protein